MIHGLQIVAEGTAAQLAVQAAATPKVKWKSDTNTVMPAEFGAALTSAGSAVAVG